MDTISQCESVDEEEYFSANDQSEEEYFSINDQSEDEYFVVNGLRNYSDLEDYFEEYPTAVLLARMPSGQIVTITESSLDELLWKNEGSYRDSEDYDMANFEVLSVIRNNEEVNRRIREGRRHRRQPNLGGVDDVRFKIKERYVEGDYYCPTNFNCVGKCIKKYLEIIDRVDLLVKVDNLLFDMTSTIGQMNVLLKKKGVNVRVVSYTNKDNCYDKCIIVPIYKYKIKDGCYHSILILDVNKYRRKRPELEVECGYIELEDLDDLSVLEGGERLKKFIGCNNDHILSYAFDFETYRNENVKVGVLYKQEPYLLQWGNDRKVRYSFDLENPKKVVSEFLDDLKEKLNVEDRRHKKGDCSIREICMYSFNGSKFDNHILLEYMDSDEWEVTGKFLGNETIIKRFSMKCKTLPYYNRVYFIDAMLFFPPGISLERACKMFDCKNLKYDKKEFDIVDYMTKKSILENKEKIVEYGCQDVRALYELMCRYNDNMRKVSGIDLNVLSYVSLANCANKIRDCYHDQEVEIYYNVRKEIADFERSYVYGGRLMVGKQKCDEPMIPADANSLYASAMQMFEYPVGKRKYYNRKLHPEKMEEYKNKLNKREKVPLCAMKVKFKVDDKCQVPMLPVKDCKDKKSFIQIGCYTVIELQEAIKHTKCEILEVLFVQEFEGKAKIFERFVDVFSGKRKEYKKEMKRFDKNSDEYKKYDIFQNMCKLLVNSSYGSLVMRAFDNVYQFVSKEKFERDYDETVSLITVVNGRYFTRYKNKCHHDNTKPIPLGAFILSYSKLIMNRYIHALNGFYDHKILYMDTDSTYILQKDYHLLEEAGLVGDELGQCKNDYGEGMVIEQFFCTGKKMKLCKLSNGEIKTTIKGFKGLKKAEKMANLDIAKNEKNKKEIIESREQLEELFRCFKDAIENKSEEVFKEISFETMQRRALQINMIEMTRKFKMTVHEQYKVKDYKCYPLYYKFDEMEI
jgi:DNA polymerase elongation subunit (family B)